MADQIVLNEVTKRFTTKTLGDIVAVDHFNLGVQIYSLRDAGMIPQAAALATVAIGIIILLNTIVTKLTKDRKGV